MQNVRMVYKKKLIWYIRRIKKDDGLLTLCANTPPNPQATWSCGWLCVTCRLCALSHVKEDQPHLFLSPPRPLWCQVYCNGGLHLISNGLPTLDDSKDILEKVLYGIKLRAKDKQIHPLSPPPPPFSFSIYTLISIHASSPNFNWVRRQHLPQWTSYSSILYSSEFNYTWGAQ